MFVRIFLIGAVLMAGFTSCKGSVSCLDESGSDIDWWIIYKLPRNKTSKNQLVYDGTGYLYIDSSNSASFVSPDKPISSPKSSAGHTLSQIYGSSPESVGYAMYNDEEPVEVKDFYRAHSKGVVAYDASYGFWLVHSVPKYPPYADQSYAYPSTGEMYGQSMLCMSLSLAGINKAGRQFQTNGPHFYNFSMPDSLKSSLSDLYEATVHNKTISDPTSNIETLTSRGGKQFTSFAKSKEFNADLYAKLVAPSLEKNLLVESWVRGDIVKSCCAPECKYEVYNVRSLNFGGGVEFTETDDHSKWAVAEDKSTLCIGDINRMKSQYHRGGGTVCFEDSNAAALYQRAVASYYQCQQHESEEMHISLNIVF